MERCIGSRCWPGIGIALLAMLLTLSAVLPACGRGIPAVPPATGVTAPDSSGGGADNGLSPIPGEPTLLAGAKSAPDNEEQPPLPRQAAQAGIDFASNRFVVLYDENPQPAALAPYLDPGLSGAADAVRATDNAPLVAHDFFRKVSYNMAAKYGLTLDSRVFYKHVNFAVFTVPQVQSVADLDSAMLKVLHENGGLVREVCYDFYLQACDTGSTDILSVASKGDGQDVRPAQDVHPDGKSASTAPNYDNPDPYYVNHSGEDNGSGRGTWGLWRIGAILDQAWSYTTGSSNVVVAVVDTGVRYTHEDIVDNCIDPQNDAPYNAPGILTDVINKDNDPNDDHGHGTFCAGEIGAKGNNGKGLAGVNWNVTILPVKVLSASGNGTDSQVAEGMLLADYLGANIISMSLGGPFPDRTTQLAARQCAADGVLSCVAAGNWNNSWGFYPGYYPECLCVGATVLVNSSNDADFSLVDNALPVDTRYDAKTSFSCYGPWVDIAAPGQSVMSISRVSDTSYAFGWAGTSMATPYVAGCAALLWSYISDPTADKVRALLQSSAREMTHFNNGSNPKGFIDNATNNPVRFVNVNDALQLYNNGPYSAPTVSWNNPTDGATLSGSVGLRVAISGGSGTIRKVEFETPTHLIGISTSIFGGYWRTTWDTAWEFNGPVELTAKAYDNKGNIVKSRIHVICSNTHETLPFSENFTGVGNDDVPSGWYSVDGNESIGDTAWGAYNTVPGSAPPTAPAMHCSGTYDNYAASSNDWLFAPLINLGSKAKATLTFKLRYKLSSGDVCFFVVTGDDVDYTHYREWNGTGTVHDWQTITVDLSSFAGQEIRLGWNVLALSGSNEGMWIDDVSINSTSGTPPTVNIDSPSNGASVSGLVPVQLTISDDTVRVEIIASPPALGKLIFTDLPDNDMGLATKTLSFNWDSRYIYNGGVLLTALAYDDENGNGQPDDFVTRDDISLSVTNPTRNPTWYDGFENITTLGGAAGSNFDGDWFTWGGGTAKWRIATQSPHTGGKYAKMGPDGSGNYGANESDVLLSPLHNAGSAAHPMLRLWQKVDVEDSGGGDIAKLLLMRYDNGQVTAVPLAEYRSDSTPAGSWVKQVFDLGGFKDTPFRLELLFTSDSDDYYGSGWFVDDYEVIDASPSISSLSPARAKLGDTITVNGSNFGGLQDTSTVTFAKDGGGRTTATASSWSNTAIHVTVPADAAKGDVIVDVLGYDSSGAAFTLILPPPDLTGLGQF